MRHGWMTNCMFGTEFGLSLALTDEFKGAK